MTKQGRSPTSSHGYLEKVIRSKEARRRRDARRSLAWKLRTLEAMMENARLLNPKQKETKGRE